MPPANKPVPTVYELSVPGRRGYRPPAPDVPITELPAGVRDDNGLPQLGELQVARHFEHLAARNYGVETGFYPLGSCTMKYNPKVAEVVAAEPGFTNSHPLQATERVQGNLALMAHLQQWLADLGGFAAVSLQPSAGAHGEFTALMMIRRYFAGRNETERNEILIPDSAHGTNPASATMAGFTVIELPSDARGNIDLDALKAMCSSRTAALMLTNPNTLGLFDEHVLQLTQIVHDCGGLVYGDGANMNALAGWLRPADTGIDLMHYNLHKTFGTPHGGGGPGAGPLAANTALADYLPGPVAAQSAPSGQGKEEGQTGRSDEPSFYWRMPARSIGPVGANHGNFAVLVRAYAYFRLHGLEDFRNNAEMAVLNANYLRVRVAEHLTVPYPRDCMHEFVCEGRVDDQPVRAFDISKRLMDYGFHPPTNYFPLIVEEALMVEPTESEDKATLDAFADAIAAIVVEARDDPERVRSAPHNGPVGRLDEVFAARHPVFTDPATHKKP